MNLTRSAVLVVLLLLVSNSFAQNKWRSAGRVPEQVTAVTSLSGVLIAGTANGNLYTSIDTGATWDKSAPSTSSGAPITALAILYSKNLLLIGAGDGLYMGPPEGPWTPTEIKESVSALSGYGLAGTANGNVYYFDTLLKSWNLKTTRPGFPVGFVVTSGFPPNYDCLLSTGEIITSSDFGLTWTGLAQSHSDAVGISVARDGSLIVATKESGVFRSTNDGATWAPFNKGLSDMHIHHLVGNKILVGGRIKQLTETGVLGTVQYAEWLDHMNGITSTSPVTVMDLTMASILQAALEDNSYFTEATGSPFLRTSNTQSNVSFFSTNNGIWFNNDVNAGLTWPRKGESPMNYIFGGGLWFGAVKNVPPPAGSDTSWSSAGAAPDSVHTLWADRDSRQIYLATWGYDASKTGLYKRSDQVGAWTPLNVRTGVVALVRRSDGTLLLGTSTGLLRVLPNGDVQTTSITKSVAAIADNGLVLLKTGAVYQPDANWENWMTTTTIGSSSSNASVFALPNSQRVVATSNTSVFLSSDGGTSWSNIGKPAGQVKQAVLATDNSILVWCGNNIFRSIDEGATWIDRSEGLASGAITMLRSHDGVAFALASKAGAYVMTVDGLTAGRWMEVSKGIADSINVYAIDIDQNHDLHIVLGIEGRRIFTQWKTGLFRSGRTQLCEIGYNPNSGGGWYSSGQINDASDNADNTKYRTYRSTSFDASTGLPTKTDAVTPHYRWPIWPTATSVSRVQSNFNFGTYISDVGVRSFIQSGGVKPAIFSDEDIINAYSDLGSPGDGGYIAQDGLPLGLNFQERIYTWGFGRYRDVVFMRFEVENTSNDALEECYLAPGLDPDIGLNGSAAGNDHNSFFGKGTFGGQTDSLIAKRALLANSISDEERAANQRFANDPALLNMGYQWSKPEGGREPGIIGFSLLETPVVRDDGSIVESSDSVALGGYGQNSFFATHQLGLSSFVKWAITNDPVTSSNRYEFLASGRKDLDNNQEGDMRLIMSTGPFTLLPHQTVTTTLAIGIAHPSTTSSVANLDSLLRLMAGAHRFFASAIDDGGAVGLTMHHFGDMLPVVKVNPSANPNKVIRLDCFPNPATDRAVIRYAMNGVQAPASLGLFDVSGREVLPIFLEKLLTSGEHRITVDVSDLPNGSYYLKLATRGAKAANDQSVVKQIVIQR